MCTFILVLLDVFVLESALFINFTVFILTTTHGYITQSLDLLSLSSQLESNLLYCRALLYLSSVGIYCIYLVYVSSVSGSFMFAVALNASNVLKKRDYSHTIILSIRRVCIH